MASPVGHEYEFVDQVPEDYFCKLCKHVAREPTIASCCTEVLCKACIDVIVQDKKPCPSCGDLEIKALGQHSKNHAKILALEVRCTMKDRGCEWTGQLQHLNAHLDVTTGDCQYVDVECPKKCVQKVQKRNMDTHLANECPNRNYRCPHCNFTNTYRVVTEQHWDVCSYYPLACSNRCGATFERDDLEDHMKMCPLEEVQCVFSDAGCQAKFIRENEDEHMDQNIQKHLALMPAATRQTQQALERKDRRTQQAFERRVRRIVFMFLAVIIQMYLSHNQQLWKTNQELQSSALNHYQQLWETNQKLESSALNCSQQLRETNQKLESSALNCSQQLRETNQKLESSALNCSQQLRETNQKLESSALNCSHQLRETNQKLESSALNCSQQLRETNQKLESSALNSSQQLRETNQKLESSALNCSQQLRETNQKLESSALNCSQQLRETNQKLESSALNCSQQLRETNQKLESSALNCSQQLRETNQKLESSASDCSQQLRETNQKLESSASDCSQQLRKTNQELQNRIAELESSVQHLQQVLGEKLKQKISDMKLQIQKYDKQLQDEKKDLKKQSKEIQSQRDMITALQQEDRELYFHTGLLPYYVTPSNYNKKRIFSPQLYTHPGGYKFELLLFPKGANAGTGTEVSVAAYSVKGDYDAELKFPVKFTITVQLLNQHRNQDHYTRDIQCEVTREKIGSVVYNIGADWTFILHADLEWNSEKQTQYLKDDCLRFRITKIVVKRDSWF